MTMRKLLIGATALVVLAGCGAGGEEMDDRAAIVEACNTQEGAGWLRQEYGESYCECYADTAKERLDADAYRALAAASREELKAGDDRAARDAIARRNFQLNAETEQVTQSCQRQ